ncbi:hypothetical protein DSO57_1003958 [Entomophthora muscae]|uniref:Uncharacterized protein n=1 Tax=Entomophthora muscae TaxID=34485 RepID=A0ACC2RZP0_9FUNG|nr:hypothetical protein DSO57_1003958 [Entomophthora muscae]
MDGMGNPLPEVWESSPNCYQRWRQCKHREFEHRHQHMQDTKEIWGCKVQTEATLKLAESRELLFAPGARSKDPERLQKQGQSSGLTAKEIKGQQEVNKKT